MAQQFRMPEVDFGWLGNLPSVYGEAAGERERKEAMSGVDFSDPVSLRKTASSLAKTGRDKAIALSNQLNEQATKLEELQLGRGQSAMAARLLGGGGIEGDATDKMGILGQRDPELPGLIKKYAQLHGVPESEAAGLFKQESGGSATAVSSKGAAGVGQLMPGTAKDMGVTDRFNKEQNVAGSMKYFGQLLQKYGGNPGVAHAAYNWGPGNMDAYLEGRIKSVPGETQAHVRSITGRTLDKWVAQAKDPAEATAYEAEKAGRAYQRGAETVEGRASQLGAAQAILTRASPGAREALGAEHKELMKRKSEDIQAESKDFREYQTDLFKRRSAADQALTTANRMEQLLDQGTVTGWGAETAAKAFSLLGTVRQLATSLGVPVPELEGIKTVADMTAKMEEFRGLSNKLTLAAAGGSLGAQISNTDRDFIALANAALGNSPGANKLLLEMARATAMRDKEAAKIAAAYYDAGGRSRGQLEKLLAAHAEKNPIFMSGDKKLTDKGQKVQAVIDAAKRGQGAQPAAPAAPRGQGLPPIKGPDGRMYNYFGPGDLRPVEEGS